MSYEIFLEPDVHEVRRQLPGNIRQRIYRVISGLSETPRPPESKPLALPDGEQIAGVEIRRVRLEHWRIVYAISDAERWVRVFAIHRRPPYSYQDLPDIVRQLAE